MNWRTQARLAAGFSAAMVIVLGVVLSGLYADQTRLQERARSAASFDRVADQVRESVQRRITVPRYGLGGLRSMVAALGRVPTVAEFRDAVAARDLRGEFPGVVGLGFLQPVPAGDLDAFARATDGAYGGTGTFRLQRGDGAPGDAVHYVIRSIEPQPANRAALGLDISGEPVRRAAALASLRGGELAITGPVQLLQLAPGMKGALYVRPAYARTAAADGRSQRGALIGLVYAAVSYPDALVDMRAGSGLASVGLSDITDGTPQLLFANRPAEAAPAQFGMRETFEFGGRRYQVSIRSLPAFDQAALNHRMPRLIRLAGTVASVLVALLIAEWILRSFRATDMARRMVADNARLAAVGRLTHDAVAITDLDGRILWSNPAFARLAGQDEDALAGRPLARFLRLAGAEPTAQVLARLVRGREGYHGEAVMQAAEGQQTVTEIEIQPYTGHLATTTGLVVIQSDITRRKRDETALRASEAFLVQTGRAAGVGGWQLDLATGRITWTAQTRRIHEVPDDYVPTLQAALAFFPEAVRPTLQAAIERAMQGGEGWDLELPFVTQAGHERWVRAMGVVESEGGKPVRLIGALQDITGRKRNELALRENRELLRVTLSSIGDAVITTDAAGQVTWFNAVAEALIGCPPTRCAGKPIEEVLVLLNQDTRHPVDNPILLALRENRTVGLATNTLLRSHDGTEYGIEDSAAPIRDDQGKVIGGVMVFHDVTEVRAMQREVSERARHDPLTGLFNRHEFESRLRDAMAVGGDGAGRRHGVVFFIDLDHFKLVNDVAGHAAGDLLLCQIAALIQGQVRSRDTVARLGGDEFAVLLEHCPLEQARTIAQALCDAVDRYRFVATTGQVFRVGASLGVAALADSNDPVSAADAACRAAKEAGRNRHHVWSPADEGIRLRAGDTAWSVQVEKALDAGAFELHAQRIVALAPASAGEPLHAEVLLRMRGEDGSLVAPGAFLPAAERFQLVNRVDRWVVQRVFEELGTHHRALPAGSQIAVNLSGQSVGDPAFHAFVHGQMERATFDLGLLCFEITETAAITNLAHATAFLQAVRARSVRVALDDFGAGVASFGYLHSLQVDYLKIDGQYTRGMASNPLDMVSMRSFCDVARVLGVQTIAEAVETDAELSAVRALGIDYAQGFVLHRPEPLAALLGALAATG